MTNCQHEKTHEEFVFEDMEEDDTFSYGVYEVCDNCNESWYLRDYEDDGKKLGGMIVGKE